MNALLHIITNLILMLFTLSLFLFPFIYMIITIIDEDENYDTYLLRTNGKSYLVVKEKNTEK